APVEVQGLDVPELGAVGYSVRDPKAADVQVYSVTTVEPRAARLPPALSKRFAILIEGIEPELLATTWSDLCGKGDRPTPPEFRAFYPYMTPLQKNRFTFRAGSPEMMCTNLEKLLRSRLPEANLRATVEE